jgi:signal peptidase I
MKKISKHIKETAKVLLYSVVFALIFRSLFFHPFKVPSQSMIPNLKVGDRMLVNKFYYGYSRYSFPMNMIPLKDKILDSRKPKRGDIVVVRDQNMPLEYYTKRVIAIPGDTIEMKNGVVFINGLEQKIKFLSHLQNDTIDYLMNNFDTDVFLETNIDGNSYKIYRRTNGTMKTFSKIQVPDRMYFLMGDNRDNSKDSRFEEFGMWEYHKIIGKAQLIYFSSPYNFTSWLLDPTKIDFKRIFKRLDKFEKTYNEQISCASCGHKSHKHHHDHENCNDPSHNHDDVKKDDEEIKRLEERLKNI